jgi:hypothetical protein
MKEVNRAMNCQEIKRKLSAYQDKKLPGSQMDAIKSHLNNCADCSIAFQEMNEVWETIESAPYFWTRLSQRMNEKDRKQSGWNFIFAPIQKLSFSILVTCVLIFALAIGMFLGENISQHSQPTSPKVAEQELDQVFPMASFDDFPEQSVAQVYVTMLSENDQ